ncbi:MAG TPA: tyrosine--tRNA ligase [Candidatus Aphodocola excrementigallinarum]|uniref:Tyrosine--tRNA ligase n=1 Tax=Candidatus Aphodocola excrementigallinarum TaxID=2840670 RepID=A0A9D1IPM5_9FIRM|nr:tyrosine--tRNA ligase [Candidatus Aphodocola excrementigallinarum]
MTLYEDLKWRGLIQDISDEKLIDKLNNEKLTFYIGTDPTADSMHIGHYSSFLISKRLAKAGHKPILLVGGATGLIGDPKPTAERPMISKEEVEKNFKGLKKQAEEIFGFEVVNNYDWTKDINVIDFLRDYGKYFNINYMLAKDKVKSRMESGITYAEFSYMILQALDFMHLYETRGVTLQVAGSDQWGNITSGIELVRKKLGKEVYGMVMPLVTDSNGVKFGKTEGNALWLDKNKTSSYELYQYLINLEDSMIIDYLKKLTFLSKEEIEELEEKHKKAPEKREAHKALARCVITDIHGKEEYEKAVRISEALFSGNVKSLSKDEILTGFKDVPSFEVKENIKLIDMLVDNNITSSKREAREFLKAGSISINDEKVNDENMIIDKSLAINGEILVIKRGKKKNFIGLIK